MKISAGHRRPIGALGLVAPPIFFGTAALGNVSQVIPEQRKLAICSEWFRHVEPPVFVDVAYKHGGGLALEVLARMLRRLDVAGDEVVVHLSLDSTSVMDEWEQSCRLLGSEYRPKLVSIFDADDCAWRAVSELKAAGIVRGAGIITTGSRARSSLAPPVDWVVVAGGYTLMRHPPEILTVMAEFAERQIPVVVAGVFDGGFLVGGIRLDGRVLDANDPANRSLFAWRTAFAALCHAHGITPAHACIQFALSAPGVVAVALNSSHPDRVVQNVDAVVQEVPASFWSSLKEEGLLEPDYPLPC
jgi:D-threo-aldose 1-dehydrogenase